MRKPSRREVFDVLRERSTIAGIAGAVVALLGLFGIHTSEYVVTELILLVISIVAIMTRPEKPWDGITDRRAPQSGDSSRDPLRDQVAFGK